MKTLWNLLCIFALANLIALGGFVGWLVSGGRLDAARLQTIRTMLRETIAEQKAREEKEAAEAAAAAEAARPKEPLGAPLRSEDLLALRLQGDAVDQQRLERLRREISDLQATLRREREIIDEQRQAFTLERDAFQQQLARLEELKGSDQFKKSLTTLEALKPAEAKSVLLAMLGRAAAPGEEVTMGPAAPPDYDQVVAYLDAMQDRTRSKIVAEIGKDDPALAADLLERLRTHGLAARAPEYPPG